MLNLGDNLEEYKRIKSLASSKITAQLRSKALFFYKSLPFFFKL
jgi:hypothetical protein